MTASEPGGGVGRMKVNVSRHLASISRVTDPWSSFPRYVRRGRMEEDRGRRKKDNTEDLWWRAWSRFLKSSCRGGKVGWEKERRCSVWKGTAEGEEDSL